MPTTTTDLAAGTWVVDAAHSQVEFTIRHLGLTQGTGTIQPVQRHCDR